MKNAESKAEMTPALRLLFCNKHSSFCILQAMTRATPQVDATPPKGLDQLDPLLQHRSRLGAMVLLSSADLSFSRLKTSLGETDGNLGAQLRKLEDAGYLSVKKEFVDRKPTSWYALTAVGMRALKGHLRAMEEVIRGAKV
jgi:DNA-binding HxlR family transcriptional regulator